MNHGKKKRPLSPAEEARRKQASQKQITDNRGPTSDDPAVRQNEMVFTPPQNQMFRHQGR